MMKNIIKLIRTNIKKNEVSKDTKKLSH